MHRNRQAMVWEVPPMRWHQQIPVGLHFKILHYKCQQKPIKCCWTNPVQYTHWKWILVLKLCSLHCCNLEIIRKCGTAKVFLYVSLATLKSAKMLLYLFHAKCLLTHFVYYQPCFSFCSDFCKEKFRILLKTVKLTYVLS